MVAESRPIWALEDGAVYDGPFRANVESFIGHFGRAIPLKCSAARAWVVRVVDAGQDAVQPATLYIYEDNPSAEQPPVCDQCRIIGTELPNRLGPPFWLLQQASSQNLSESEAYNWTFISPYPCRLATAPCWHQEVSLYSSLRPEPCSSCLHGRRAGKGTHAEFGNKARPVLIVICFRVICALTAWRHPHEWLWASAQNQWIGGRLHSPHG